MLLKNVYQWDINSAEEVDRFREESQEMDQQAERVVYRRSNNVVPGEIRPSGKRRSRRLQRRSAATATTAIPCMSRDEFLEQVLRDLEQGFTFEPEELYHAYNECEHTWVGHDVHSAYGKDIPRGIVIRAVVEHRDGAAVRAEFLELRGDPLAELQDPNANGIQNRLDDGLMTEDGAGRMWMDPEILQESGITEEEAERMASDLARMLNRRDLDDREDRLREFVFRAYFGYE